jgi:hypothetical protein
LLALTDGGVEIGLCGWAFCAAEELRVVVGFVEGAVGNCGTLGIAVSGDGVEHSTGRASDLLVLDLTGVGGGVEELVDGAHLATASAWVPVREIASTVRTGL